MNEMHLALHGLAIKKHADPAAVAIVTGLCVERAAALLEQAVASGRAAQAQGSYLLTPAGRMILDGQYSRYYDEVRGDAGFVAAYERFERINTDLKQVITDWQTKSLGGERLRNDHADPDYDARILDRLATLHERFEPVCRQLAAKVARLGEHFARLEHALDRAEQGAREWVSDAKLASYHTVWFEMHEDLLRLLGQQRVE